MVKVKISLSFFLLLFFASYGQRSDTAMPTVRVSGTVIDKNSKQPLEYATVVLSPKNGTSDFQWRERSFNLSFTYRFNQKKKREQQRRGNDGGGGEEFGT